MSLRSSRSRAASTLRIVSAIKGCAAPGGGEVAGDEVASLQQRGAIGGHDQLIEFIVFELGIDNEMGEGFATDRAHIDDGIAAQRHELGRGQAPEGMDGRVRGGRIIAFFIHLSALSS